MTDLKTETISVRCTKRERWQIKHEASKAGLSVSGYLLFVAEAARAKRIVQDNYWRERLPPRKRKI